MMKFLIFIAAIVIITRVLDFLIKLILTLFLGESKGYGVPRMKNPPPPPKKDNLNCYSAQCKYNCPGLCREK